MSVEDESDPSRRRMIKAHGLSVRARDWFAASLGVRQERKEELNIELSKSATLKDLVYWLQIFFAAGIATLGLILNSPAIIIGAMLISPLMGPILASGLALATGDLILGIRATVNLALSCLAAITFAVLLVAVLPFKEMTNEIAGRTSPTTLDLFVALFSGAIGSIAICREVKGVVTSIPGVAIAVALMPPLCVVGYGAGIALSVNGAEGMRVATGGGLLFLTNLVAITFTAMIVFVLLRIDTKQVREKIEEWRHKDPESLWWHHLFEKIPALEHAREIRSLPLRLLMILIPLMIIVIPLTQSFIQLRAEITKKQQENRMEQTALSLWQQYFEKSQNGDVRSYLDALSVKENEGKTQVYLRVFDNISYTAAERAEYVRLLASHLNRPANSIALQIVEIPTFARDTQQREERIAPLSVAQLQANFLQRVQFALSDLRLPPPARQVDYQITNSLTEPLHVQLSYISEREIGTDAQMLLAEDVKARLNFPSATLSLERIPTDTTTLVFERDQANWKVNGANPLDAVGVHLRKHPRLKLEVILKKQADEKEGILEERQKTIAEYLKTNWQVSSDKIVFIENPTAQDTNFRVFLPD